MAARTCRVVCGGFGGKKAAGAPAKAGKRKGKGGAKPPPLKKGAAADVYVISARPAGSGDYGWASFGEGRVAAGEDVAVCLQQRAKDLRDGLLKVYPTLAVGLKRDEAAVEFGVVPQADAAAGGAHAVVDINAPAPEGAPLVAATLVLLEPKAGYQAVMPESGRTWGGATAEEEEPAATPAAS